MGVSPPLKPPLVGFIYLFIYWVQNPSKQSAAAAVANCKGGARSPQGGTCIRLYLQVTVAQRIRRPAAAAERVDGADGPAQRCLKLNATISAHGGS